MTAEFSISGRRAAPDLNRAVRTVLDDIDFRGLVVSDDCVFVKPNLVWKERKPGVTTSPSVLSALLATLKDRAARVIVGESDGGNRSFPAEEAFRAHDLPRLCAAEGAELVNLSKLPTLEVDLPAGATHARIPLPKLLIRDVNRFVTAPVVKTHAMTTLSCALKNQWGCIPDSMRLKYHPIFNSLLAGINSILDPKIALVDATFVLDGRGPLMGNPIRADVVLAGNNAVATDLHVCKLVGISPDAVAHLEAAIRAGLGPPNHSEIDVLGDKDLTLPHLRVRRSVEDYIAVGIAKNRLFNSMMYGSPLSPAFRKVLQLARREGSVG